MKKVYAMALIALGCLGLVACTSGGSSSERCLEGEGPCAIFAQGDRIRIGLAGPLTGDAAYAGTDIAQGAQIAIEDANKSPIEGWRFELVSEDSMGTPEGGASVANLFVSDEQMVAVVGHAFSGSTEAAIPIYDAESYPMMSPSATNPSLTELGSRVFNRIVFTDEKQGAEAAAYIYDTLAARRIAVLHDGGAYGQGLARVVRERFEALGGQVLAFEAITPGESDYTAPLAALAGRQPELIFFGGYVAEAAVLVSQMPAVGLAKASFFAGDGVFSADFIKLAGSNAEGAYATSVIPPQSPAKLDFDRRYLELFGMESGSLSPFSWNGYDSAAALISAIRKVAVVKDGQLHIGRAALANAVRSIRNLPGLSGTISCDSQGECNTAGPSFYIVKDRNWTPAEAAR